MPLLDCACDFTSANRPVCGAFATVEAPLIEPRRYPPSERAPRFTDSEGGRLSGGCGRSSSVCFRGSCPRAAERLLRRRCRRRQLSGGGRRQRRWRRRDDGGTARDLREAVPGGPGGEVERARRRGPKAGERTLGGRGDRRGAVRRRFAEVEHPGRRGNEFVSGRRLASGPGPQARGAGHTRANRGGHRRSAAAAEAGSFGKVSPAGWAVHDGTSWSGCLRSMGAMQERNPVRSFPVERSNGHPPRGLRGVIQSIRSGPQDP